MGKQITLIYPFNSDEFLDAWKLYQDFRWQEHKFRYKSLISEQAGLKKLGRISDNNENAAIEIIHQTLENNWRGLFKLIPNNEQSTSNTTEPRINRQSISTIQKNLTGWEIE
jgi:hypothetical protein